ncbi:MAG: SAM-dependent methyltransferase [Clostridia bacterium]|nr:SAM-dependent methyltransferase [Clostridia bacterium]
MIKLEPRLFELCDMVRGYSCVADIGCDHGRLSCALLQSFDIKRVIAADISETCLQKARKLAEKCGLLSRIDIRCGDGLSVLCAEEADAVIIAGMGGELISNILENSKNTAKHIKRFAFQPMRGIEKLRRYLYNNDYRIIKDKIIKEGRHWYQLICVEHGTPLPIPQGFPPDLFLLGYVSFTDEEKYLPEYLDFLIKAFNKRIDDAAHGGFIPEKLLTDYENLKAAKSIVSKM